MHCPICQTANADNSLNCAACGAPLGAGMVAVSPDALPVGSLLQGGNFTIERVLGQGGFGITYLAADNSLGRRVAIKEFFPASCARQGVSVQPASKLSLTAYHDARRRFLDEARNLARFRDPGIVAVHSVFEGNNTAYMVMEYLQGQSLSEVLHERGGCLNQDEALGLIHKVGHSLDVVHAAGLLHRDIKPDNVIVCGDGRVVLIDFGTARDFAAGSTQGHTVAVTPGYAPLEQYASRAVRGIYTDVYGLAATLYYLLSGEVPTAASDRAMGVPLLPLEQLNPQVRESVACAVMQGLEIEVAKRPQSVREFLELLEGKVMAGGRRDMTDAEALTHIATHRKDLLNSPDPEVQEFLRALALDCNPDEPIPSSLGLRKFSAHLKAREALLGVSTANAQRYPAVPSPVQPSAATAQSASSAPQLKPTRVNRREVYSWLAAVSSVVFLVYIMTFAGFNERPSSPPKVAEMPSVSNPAPQISTVGVPFPSNTATPEKRQVVQRWAEYINAWFQRDAPQCMSFYAPEARIFRPEREFNYQQWHAHLPTELPIESDASRSAGTHSIEVNGNRATLVTFGSGQTRSKLHCSWTKLQIWQKKNDRWMIVEDRLLTETQK